MPQRVRIWLIVLALAVPMVALIYRPDEVGPWIKIAFAYPKDIAWLLAYDAVFLLVAFLSGLLRISHAWFSVIIYGLAAVAATLIYAVSPSPNTWGIALILPPIIFIPVQMRITTLLRRSAKHSQK